jgi:hypothetical protein
MNKPTPTGDDDQSAKPANVEAAASVFGKIKLR